MIDQRVTFSVGGAKLERADDLVYRIDDWRRTSERADDDQAAISSVAWVTDDTTTANKLVVGIPVPAMARRWFRLPPRRTGYTLHNASDYGITNKKCALVT
jgi:hypothetical protein